MPISKLMIVDPGSSQMGVVRRILCCGIGVVLCYTGASEDSPWLDELVEVRHSGSKGFSVGDIDCILEFIDTEEKRIEFLRSEAVINSGVPVLSRGTTLSFRDVLCSKVGSSVLSRIVNVNLPSFYQKALVFECAFHAENSADCRNLLKKLLNEKVKLIAYEGYEYGFYDKIGYFFATACIVGAYVSEVDVEVADYIIACENTGISLGTFATLDRLGIDIFLKALECRVEDDEMLRSMYKRLPLVIYDMVSDGVVGLGSRGGFYRTYDMLYGKVSQVIDIASGLYRLEKRDMYLHECLLDNDRCEKFIQFVWQSFFSYVKRILELYGASCLSVIDAVLCTGYGWKYGVREIASRTGIDFQM
ncbi:hypothetical protein R4I06_02535 [Anaplasma bovis]